MTKLSIVGALKVGTAMPVKLSGLDEAEAPLAALAEFVVSSPGAAAASDVWDASAAVGA